MIQLSSAAQLAKAIERAKAGKLFVQTTSFFRMYQVTNRASGSTYTVNFFVENGSRYADCTCKAGKNRIACKHVAAAAGLHVVRAAQLKASKQQTTH
jgi:uncharacterized Zn finger protein